MKPKTGRCLTELLPELQTNILSRLPVKSLLFCKCVCKSLRTFISNPSFIQSHLSIINSMQPSLILQYNHEKHLMLYTTTRSPNVSSLYLTPLLPKFLHHKPNVVTVIVGSCNGLILVSVWLGDLVDELLLWNPVIRQHRYLPEPNHKCSSFYEFGFIAETNDYVVLKIGRIEPVIEMYKTSIDSWVTVDVDLSWWECELVHKRNWLVNPLFLNGSCHWTDSDINDRDVVYYNIKDEKLGVIKAVDCSRFKWFNEYRGYGREFIFGKKFAMIDQSLAMIYYQSVKTFPLEIWVMNDYGVEDSWTLRFLIHENVSEPCCHLVGYHLVGYWTSGLMIMDETARHNCGGPKSNLVTTFMLYDVHTRSMTTNIARMPVCEISGFCSFVESLVPVIKVD